MNNSTSSTGRNTLIAIGVILITIGLGVSYLFSQEIKKFFWEAHTSSVTLEVTEVGGRLFKENYIERWRDADARVQIETFVTGIKRELPHVIAVKIFTPEGVAVWSDLESNIVGETEEDLVLINDELRKKGIVVEEAGILSKEETGKSNLLEVYAIINGPQGELIGFIECYFDSSDIATFIAKTRYTILASVLTVIFLIVFLLRLVFRQKNDIIVRQAHELANLIEQSPVGIYTINAKGEITSINPKMLALIEEADANKILGQKVWGLKSIMRMNVADLIKEALLGVPFDKEVRSDDKNGNEIHSRYRGTPLTASDGKTVEQVLFMVEDVTEHVKLERTVAEHTRALEEGVSDRTKELQDKIAELEQFQKLTVGREIRMMEIKQENEELRAKLESKSKE